MRKGYDANWLLNPKGEIIAISTGSDATSEHEWGCASLMQQMCGCAPLYAKDTAERILRGGLRAIPDVLEARKVRANLPELVFVEGRDQGSPMAAIGFSARGHRLSGLCTHPELALSRYEAEKGMFCSGAWDDSSFGFSVRGAKHVERLRRFHAALLDGHGMFAGLFLRSPTYSGVVLCDVTRLRPEHRVLMQAAQDLFAQAVRKHVAEANPALQV